jgi:hypothetical protein
MLDLIIVDSDRTPVRKFSSISSGGCFCLALYCLVIPEFFRFDSFIHSFGDEILVPMQMLLYPSM